MTDQQLELGFDEGRSQRPLNHRQRRLHRAAWWFARMRRIVDQAMDWDSPNPGRPEQTWLPGSHRHVRV